MGKHALLEAPPTTAATPDSFAFAVGHDDDPDQLRAFWIRSDDSPLLEIIDQSGGRLYLPADQIPALISLLTASETFAPYLAGAR